ncbi:MAG: archease [Candidatus Magnetoovum sp. WYHC-5]|nr:archease [Candidatus Magnetoovum sp. WYHC-5]
MGKYEILDISGDVGLKIIGYTLEELFINAALGLYSLITDVEGIVPTSTMDVSVEGEPVDILLVAWLNELIYHFDVDGFIGYSVKNVKIESGRFSAQVVGELFDERRHERRLLVKAATYHRLVLKAEGDFLVCECVLDI